MKRFAAIALAMTLMLLSAAFAETIDLTGLTFDELVALKNRINLAMWQCDEWQEVTVPPGLYKVGEDIPAGHWTVKAKNGAISVVTCGRKLKENKASVDLLDKVTFSYGLVSPSYHSYDMLFGLYSEVQDFEVTDGYYIDISMGSVIFSPYTGKPSLGFK